MFEKKSLGIAFEADGTVRVAELTSNMRTVILSRVWTIQPEGADNFDSWKQAIDRLRESKVDLDNAVIGIPDSGLRINIPAISFISIALCSRTNPQFIMRNS